MLNKEQAIQKAIDLGCLYRHGGILYGGSPVQKLIEAIYSEESQ